LVIFGLQRLDPALEDVFLHTLLRYHLVLVDQIIDHHQEKLLSQSIVHRIDLWRYWVLPELFEEFLMEELLAGFVGDGAPPLVEVVED